LFGGRARAALQSVLTIAGINFLIGLSPGIDNWGHMGGLLGGLMFSWFAGPRLEVFQDYPHYRIKDVTPANTIAIGGALVVLVFGMLAILRMGM
jgi:rhomboid protease GluP